MTHGRIHALSLLSTKILNSCSIYDGQVGDFQVATGGGFWVAIRVKVVEHGNGGDHLGWASIG